MCDALGLWCIVVISENNPDKGIRYRHAWNIVRIGGQYYHLDATFDNSLGGDGVIRYDYFNLDDKKIFRDHEPILTHAPACTQGDRFFYREQKLSFTKQEEVGRRALQAIRKKKPLIFHWRGGYLTRDVLGEMVALLERDRPGEGAPRPGEGKLAPGRPPGLLRPPAARLRPHAPAGQRGGGRSRASGRAPSSPVNAASPLFRPPASSTAAWGVVFPGLPAYDPWSGLSS